MPTAEYEPRLPTYRDVLRAYDRAWTTWQDDPSLRSFAVLQTGIEILYRELEKPGKFALGQVLMTPDRPARPSGVPAAPQAWRLG